MNLKVARKFIKNQKWTFAKTMAKTPHEYVVWYKLSQRDKKLFSNFCKLIREEGYMKKFKFTQYKYFDVGRYKYWVMENIINRAKIKK